MKEKATQKVLFLILLAVLSIGLCGRADAQALPESNAALDASDAPQAQAADGLQYTTNGSEATITGCSNNNVTSVNIPEYIDGYKVTRIGEGAFGGYSSLSSVTFPDSVIEIGDLAFYRCLALTAVTLPKNLEILGKQAFQITRITSITIPKSLKTAGESYGKGPFDGPIRSVTFEEGMTRIPDYLMSIAGSGLDESGEYSIVLPSTLKEIGKYAFSGWSIKSLTFPESLETVGERAFQNCGVLKAITFQGSSRTPVRIGKEAFFKCASLTQVDLSGVAEIEAGAFERCETLAEVTLPDSLTGLGHYVFGDTAVKKLTVPSALTKVIREDNYSHGYLLSQSLEEVTFAEGTKKILPYILYGCKSLKSVRLPDSVTEIGEYAFVDCTNAGIHMPASLQKIGSRAFSGCAGLTHVSFSKNLEEIEQNAFENCTGLETVLFSEKKNANVDVSFRAFENCTGLKAADLSGVKYLRTDAFKGCSSLEEINLPDAEQIAGGVFQNCSSLKNIDLPKFIYFESNAPKAFSGCTSLKKIRFGDTPHNSMAPDTFEGVTADVYYYTGDSYANKRWPSMAGKNYGGRLTWHELKKPQPPTCAAVSASVKSGSTVKKGTKVTLSTTTKGADIYYTLDGSDPSKTNNKSRKKYAGPLTITKKVTIKACAVKTNLNNSAVAAFSYSIQGAASVPQKNLEKGNAFTLSGSGLKLTVTKAAKGKTPGQAQVTGLNKNKTSVTIPAKVTAPATGETFQVTAIGAQAFYGCKKLKSVTLGTEVKTIGSRAFYKCGKLTRITVKSTKLNKVGSQAITGIHKKAQIKVPARKLKVYKKIFTKKTGKAATMKIVK